MAADVAEKSGAVARVLQDASRGTEPPARPEVLECARDSATLAVETWDVLEIEEFLTHTPRKSLCKFELETGAKCGHALPACEDSTFS
jgi:hypothetical protein